MAFIRIDTFGGVAPRLSARALIAGNFAQENSDLLATAAEFRPLQGDRVVQPATAGALTVHRITRDTSGALRTGEDGGWVIDLVDKSYVRGQLNDDATERTVVTTNDGTAVPRVIDARGADRLLGVPAPASIGVLLQETPQFTRTDALAWVSSEMIPQLAQALRDALYEDPAAARYDSWPPPGLGTGWEPDSANPWRAFRTTAKSVAARRGLTAPELGGRTLLGLHYLPLTCLPLWGRVRDVEALKARIRQLTTPKDGHQAFTEAQVTDLAQRLAGLMDPETAKAQREQLTKAIAAFNDAAGRDPEGANNPRPVEPTKPTVPQWSGMGQGGEAGGGQMQETPQWTAYNQAMAQWRRDVEAWERGQNDLSGFQAGTVQAVLAAQAAAQAATAAIEQEYVRRRARIDELVTDMVNGMNLVGDTLPVDPDRSIETRFYVATHVTDWGEESAPSPISEAVEMDQNDKVRVTLPAPPAGRHIAKWRIYRSNVGTESAAFQFVEELLATQLTYDDALAPERLGEPCPTFGWAEPPARLDERSASPAPPLRGADPYLRGAVAMPNGIVAGFLDNFVAFCHPYHPYAWPVEYQITTEHPIVGLGVFGNTLFVGTLGYPYFISGSDSASMMAERRPEPQPCVSRRSIASAEGGVLYASPDGICFASHAGIQVVTQALFAREDWQALDPASITGVVYEETYYFWTATQCWALDFAAKKLLRVTGAQATAVYRDVITDGLYAVVGSQLKRLFAEGRREGAWKSPRLVAPRQAPLAWLQADGDQDAANPLTVQWWGDGELRHTATLTSILPQRLPPGRWLEHEVRLSGRARVTKVVLAGSTQELQEGA